MPPTPFLERSVKEESETKRQRNDQDIGLTKRRCTAYGNVVLSGDRADENDENEAASQEVENNTTRA